MSESGVEALVAVPGVIARLEALGQTWFVEKGPVLPERHVQRCARWLPWIVLGFLPVHLMAVTALLGVHVLASELGYPGWFGAAVALVRLALDVAALPGLFRFTRTGWRLFTLGSAVSAIGSVLRMDLFGVVVGAGCLWLMFQIRSRYSA